MKVLESVMISSFKGVEQTAAKASMQHQSTMPSEIISRRPQARIVDGPPGHEPSWLPSGCLQSVKRHVSPANGGTPLSAARGVERAQEVGCHLAACLVHGGQVSLVVVVIRCQTPRVPQNAEGGVFAPIALHIAELQALSGSSSS